MESRAYAADAGAGAGALPRTIARYRDAPVMCSRLLDAVPFGQNIRSPCIPCRFDNIEYLK